MVADLTSADYAILIVLKAAGRELSNNEMAELYQFRLVSPVYEKLNAAGYVASETKRRPYRHALTEEGRKLLADPLAIEADTAEEGEKRSFKERCLWAAVVAQLNNGVEPHDEPADLQDRIRAAYAKLAGAAGEWVPLTALRPLVVDVSKAEFDRALVRMLDAPDVRLEPETHRHRIDADERNASVRVGGEARHKLAIGLR
jgi:DNA-binding MarR family transcriptional regulator